MIPPYSSRHAQTRSMNASRPIASRVVPSLASSFSTWRWVAIPAWSVPSDPLRAPPQHPVVADQASWTEPLSAWPMCSAPVTFGGGTAIE